MRTIRPAGTALAAIEHDLAQSRHRDERRSQQHHLRREQDPRRNRPRHPERVAADERMGLHDEGDDDDHPEPSRQEQECSQELNRGHQSRVGLEHGPHTGENGTEHFDQRPPGEQQPEPAHIRAEEMSHQLHDFTAFDSRGSPARSGRGPGGADELRASVTKISRSGSADVRMSHAGNAAATLDAASGASCRVSTNCSVRPAVPCGSQRGSAGSTAGVSSCDDDLDQPEALEQRRDRLGEQQLSVLDEPDPVGQPLDVVDVVGGDEDRPRCARPPLRAGRGPARRGRADRAR